MLFRDGYEDYWARQRLTERIAQAVLPPGATPSLDPVAGPGRRNLPLHAGDRDTQNLQELSEIQRWMVIPALKSVPGVVDDTNFGGFTTEYQLDLDPKQLQHYGLGITDVINAINNNNANAGGGRVSRGDQSYVIRGVGLIHNLAEIGSIVVTQVGGTPVLVRDLGSTALSHQEREGILGKDKNPDTIEGIVLMLKYQNPSQTLRGVHAKVAELNAKLAEQGVRIVPYIDRDDLVKATIHKVGTDHSRRHRAGLSHFDPVSRQPAQRLRGRGEHSFRAGGGLFAAESHARVGQPAVAWARSISAFWWMAPS